MPVPKSKYGIVTGDYFFYFSANDSVYTSLKDDLGLVSDPAGKIPEPMHERSSMRVRIAVSLKPATAGARGTVGKLYCDRNKVQAALAALPGKTYNGKQIVRAYIPRSINYG